jgi:hypothetical protein
MAKQDFYAMYMPQAQAAAAQLNVPAEAILNQWGLETGWGKSVIPGTNNLGNIKSTNGKGVYATDNMTGSRDPYRQYASADDFTNDYVRLIKSRYPQAVGAKDALAFGTALKAGGYAEDPNYAQKVAGMANTAIPSARSAYDREDPASVYQFMMANSRDIPVQQLTPEQQEMMLATRQQRAAMLPLSIGAALSGDKRLNAVGAALMKDANSARGPMEVDGGYMLENGQFIENPIAATNREENRQNRALTLAVSSAQNAMNKRLQNEATFQQTGYTPQGQQIVTNRTGMNYVLSQGPDGEPVYTPYSGASVPKTTWDKNVQASQDATASADRSDKIIQKVEENPDSFSMTAGAISYLPQFAQGRAAKLLLDKDALQTRTDVLRQAAQEISSLYGAALSLGEQQRANTFIPNEKDPPEIVMQKLKAARDWARTTAGQYGTGVSNAAAARTGAPAASPGGMPSNDAIAAELARRGVK